MLEWLKPILGEHYSDEIDKKVSDEIGKAFVSRPDFNTLSAELKQHKETLKERDDQLEALKKSKGDHDALQQQIADLQKQNKEQSDAHAKELKSMRRTSIDEAVMLEMKARNSKAVLALLEDVDDGADEDAYRLKRTEQLKKLAGAEETAFLFNSSGQASAEHTKLKGFSPGQGKGGLPDAAAQYLSAYDEARKGGKLADQVRIKQEAASNGVFLT